MLLELGQPPLSAPARRIADAAVDVASERGYEGLSVRSVAHRAGLTGGAVQHHFPTRADLLGAALLRTAERIVARLDLDSGGRSAKEMLLRLGEELLPLDEPRRAEGVVWVVLSAAAATDERLAELHRQAVDALTDAVVLILGAMPSARPVAMSFVGIVDGLTLHCVSGARTAAHARIALATTVESLVAAVSESEMREESSQEPLRLRLSNHS